MYSSRVAGLSGQRVKYYELRKSVRFGTPRSSRAPGWGEDGEDSAQPEGPVESANQAKLGQNQ